MNEDPGFYMQVELVKLLKDWARLRVFTGDRVFDEIPTRATYPLVAIGADQNNATENDPDCFDGTETFLEVQAFSTEPGYAELKKMVGEIRAAIRQWKPVVPGHSVEIADYRGVTYGRDAAGRRAIVSIYVLSQRDSDD